MAVDLKPVAPTDAIAFMRQKGLEPGFDYRDVWQRAHSKAFTIAKMMQPDLLADARDILDRGLSEGRTIDQISAEIADAMKAKGWWGRQQMTDPQTGVTQMVQLGSDRRVRTIVETNLRQAYQYGYWQRAWRTRASLPYLMYIHNDVRYPRPEHEAWNGIVLRIDNPWWRTHYPQCAWGCKCSTRQLSDLMLKQRGLKVTAEADIPRFPTIEYVNKRTGEISQVEQGIDPSFNYNVGNAPLRGLTTPPRPVSATGTVVTNPADRKAVEAFAAEIGISEQGVVRIDREGWPVTFSPGMVEDGAGRTAVPRPDLIDKLPDVAATLKKPDRIDWVWQTVDGADEVVGGGRAGIQMAMDTGRSVVIAKVSPRLQAAARQGGLVLRDLNHVVDGSHLVHILKRHQDVQVEMSRGQLPVTMADLLSIHDVITQATFIGVADGGHVAFVRPDKAGALIYFARYGRTSGRLNGVTVWRVPNAADAVRKLTNPDQNVRGDVGMKYKIIPMPLVGNGGAILARRYTKRVDGGEMMVDLSRAGWTYDLKPQ